MYIDNKGYLKEVSKEDLIKGKLILPKQTLFIDENSIPEKVRQCITAIEFNNELISIGICGLTEIKAKTLNLPCSLKEIGYKAFAYCSELEEINLSQVEEIAAYAFYNNSKLEQVTLPSTLKSLRYKAFKGCTSLKEVVLAKSITSLDNSLFEDCYNLERVINSEYLKNINKDTFKHCNKLNIKLNSNVDLEYPFLDTNCNVEVYFTDFNTNQYLHLRENLTNGCHKDAKLKKPNVTFRFINSHSKDCYISMIENQAKVASRVNINNSLLKKSLSISKILALNEEKVYEIKDKLNLTNHIHNPYALEPRSAIKE